MMAVLDIQDLSVSYSTPRGSLKALRNVSMAIPEGKITGIVGESGCGKSTLISAIIRLMAPNARVGSGAVRFKGEDLLARSEAGMEALRGTEISMVFQDPMQTHNPVLTVGQQMVDIQYRDRKSKAEKLKRAAEMLALVGIPDPEARLNQYPFEFSGGMRQRIAIAMALMAKPSLLIADEPTTALDATLEVQIIKRLKELQDEIGCSILFISHHLGVIAELCDEVVVMYAGEVVERGSVRDVFHTPAHPYTKALLDCDPGPYQGQDPALADDPRQYSRPRRAARGLHLHRPLPEAARGLQEAPRHDACRRRSRGRLSPVERGGAGMSALLDIRDVFVRFRVRGGVFSSAGAIDAVSGVSLTVEEGKTYGIVGESGSGKTTLARAVAGLHHASEGSIRYRGQELVDLPEAEFRKLRREVVMMFQDPIGSLSPRLTVKSLITEPFRIQGLKGRDLDAEAKRLLTMVGLPPEFAARYPYQISGGQARRVGVARALALDPKLLIADEPTAGLDVSIQGEMLNLLAKLQDELGLAIMIITHNLNVVRHITDKVGIMYLGKLVEEGPTEEVFRPAEAPLHAGASGREPRTRPRRAAHAGGAFGRAALDFAPPRGLRVPHPLPLRAAPLSIGRAGMEGAGRGRASLPFPGNLGRKGRSRIMSATIFHGGPILTMDSANSTPEAVGIAGERIVAVGRLDAGPRGPARRGGA